jgi:hypothetical protein
MRRTHRGKRSTVQSDAPSGGAKFKNFAPGKTADTVRLAGERNLILGRGYSFRHWVQSEEGWTPGFGAFPPSAVPPPVPSVRCDRAYSRSWWIPSLAGKPRRRRGRGEISPALGPNGSLCVSSEAPPKWSRGSALWPPTCRIQSCDQPPSTGSSRPVVKVASKARKRTALAISSEVPKRFIGIMPSMCSLT